jgi:hypothetical protein
MSHVQAFEIFFELIRMTILIRTLHRAGQKASEILRRVISSPHAQQLALAAAPC